MIENVILAFLVELCIFIATHFTAAYWKELLQCADATLANKLTSRPLFKPINISILSSDKLYVRSARPLAIFDLLPKHKTRKFLEMSTPLTVKTRILIISDTHSAPLAPSSSSQPFRRPLPSADVLIHCGDLTMVGLPSEYHKTLDMLASIDAPVKLIIAGNHDRTLDKTRMKNHEKMLQGKKWERLYEEAREIWFGEEGRARKEGVRMLEEGVHKVELSNGAVLKVSGFPSTPVLQQESVSF